MIEKKKPLQLVYGSRVTPERGEYEVVKRGRLVVYQDLIPELDGETNPAEIKCRIFAPIEHLATLRRRTFLHYDDDAIFPCLILQGETEEAIRIIQEIFPDIEVLNSDDDEVFEKYLSESAAAMAG